MFYFVIINCRFYFYTCDNFIEVTLGSFLIYSILLCILSCLSKEENSGNKFLDKDS